VPSPGIAVQKIRSICNGRIRLNLLGFYRNIFARTMSPYSSSYPQRSFFNMTYGAVPEFALGFICAWLIMILFFGPAVATMLALILLLPNSPADIPNSAVGAQYFFLWKFRFIFGLAISWLYFAAFESSKYRATSGKTIFGLAVIAAHGQRLSFWHATGRYFSKILLLPLMFPIYSDQIVRVSRQLQREPFGIAGLRMWREFRHLIFAPPQLLTDEWSGAYVINSIALNNPHVPNLNEHLTTEESKNPNEVSDLLLASQITFGVVTIIYGMPIFYSLRDCWSGHFGSLVETFLFFLLVGTPYLYYLRLRRRKQKLLAGRKAKFNPTSLNSHRPRTNS
jgi:uncharacterized RDD family membrane protein YckC